MARAPRSTEVAAERRRRKSDEMDGYRVTLGTEGLDLDPNYEHRWINDDGSRVYSLTQEDDYDPVQTEDGLVKRRVGTGKDGTALHAVLVRKRKDFCEEDRAKRQAAANEPLRALHGQRRGDSAGGATYVATDTTVTRD